VRAVVRVLLWILLFAGCAGVGALIAARSNPFPPGVEGGPSQTTSPSPQARSWTLRFESDSWHRFYYGGRCRSIWKGSVKMTASSDGAIDGTGRARLVGRLVCGFPNAQIQARVLDLLVRGHVSGQDLVLTISASSVLPHSSHDYGGFMATVLRRAVTLPLGARTLRRSSLDSTGRGKYSSETTFALGCTAACP
jgi:hypothetical protein